MQMLCRREQISPIGWHRLHVIIYTLLVVLFPFCNTSRIMMLLDRRTTVSYRDTTGNRVQRTEERGKRKEERWKRKDERDVFRFHLCSFLFHFSFPFSLFSPNGKITDGSGQRWGLYNQTLTFNLALCSFLFALSSLLFPLCSFTFPFLISAHYLHACNHLNLTTLRL